MTFDLKAGEGVVLFVGGARVDIEVVKFSPTYVDLLINAPRSVSITRPDAKKTQKTGATRE